MSFIFLGLFILLVLLEIVIFFNKNPQLRKKLNYGCFILMPTLYIFVLIYDEDIFYPELTSLYTILVIIFLLAIIINY